MSESPSFRGEINLGIYEQRRFPAVEAEQDFGANLQWARSGTRFVACQIVCELENHIRPGRHFPNLRPTQSVQWIDFVRSSVIGVSHKKPRLRVAVQQFHTPTEEMSFVGPVHISRIEQMPERNEELNDEVERN